VAEHGIAGALAIPGVERLEPVGRGGFATVYRGWQADFGRDVAVKLLDGGDDVAARFERERRAMGSVSGHRHVVPVYEAGTVNGSSYLVMPWLAGGSLADRIGQGALQPDDVVEVGVAIADGLQAVHEAGLLHRDVKPANILFTAYGEPQLADFGIARFTDSTLTHGSFTATVAFAAPEVLSGAPATVASDVYSLGATLYAALVGRSPYVASTGESPVALGVRVVRDDPAPLPRHLPLGLREVVARAMSREPSLRYGSAAELAAALRDAADIVIVDEPPPTRVAPEARAASAPRGTPRRPWVPVLLVAGLLLTGLAAVLLASRDHSDTPSRQAATETTASTAPPPTTKAAPTAAAPATREGGVAQAARSYYALLDGGDIDAAWDRLTPAYQARVGESSYRGFWQTIARVDVLEATADGSDAHVLLRYTRHDSTTSTERATLTFTGSATPLIDDFRAG
jgi:serine/threonine protein kinase